MSKYSISSKTTAVLIGFSLLVTAFPAFAQDNRVLPVIRPPYLGQAATPSAVTNGPRITIKEIENRIETEREKIASRAALLKTKLQTFRDQAKATIAERINTNLNQINQNQTRIMQGYLDTMSAILDKLENRVNQPTPDIKNPAGAKVAIASARAVIATASASIVAQAQKDYTIQVTTEGRIKLDAQSQRDKLKTDLLAIRKAVIDAKQAVINAIVVAKSGSVPTGTGLGKEGTTSGQQ